MVDLPVSDVEAQMEEEFGPHAGSKSSSLTAFPLKRFRDYSEQYDRMVEESYLLMISLT